MKKLIPILTIIATLAGGCSSANKADESGKDTDTTEASSDRNNDIATDRKDINIIQPTAAADEDEAASVAPLTQYALIEVLDGNIGVGFRHNSEEVLKSLGFTVKEFKRPADVDEMTPFVYMTAHRQEPSGSTNIAFRNGEDQILTIDFASRDDVKKFVESMQKSGYEYYDGIYAHSQNKMGLGQIYVKVRGLKVKIISPFEMLPSEW